MAKHLNTLALKIKGILEEYPEARDNDGKMYWILIKELCDEKGYDVHRFSAYSIIIKYKEYGFPNMESAGRARRKIQEEYPELRGSKKAVEARKESEEEYYQFALSGI